MSITIEKLAHHFARFGRSLKNYPDQYLPIFFRDPSVAVEHIGYLCPLCLKTGIICSESLGTGFFKPFSEDHFPPKSVGGTLELLVCKDCNDHAGHAFDYVLKDRLSELSFEKRIPNAILGARSQIDGLASKGFNGFFQIDQQGEITISFKRNENDRIPPLDEWTEKAAKGLPWKVDATIKRTDQRKIDQAILKAAYLHCFLHWGYEFAFSTTGERIRDVIRGERNYPIRTDQIIIDKETPADAPEGIPLGVCKLVAPQSVDCFIVSMKLSDIQTGYTVLVIVPIPGPSTGDWDSLPLILNTIIENGTFQFQHVRDHGLDDGILDGYRRSWLRP